MSSSNNFDAAAVSKELALGTSTLVNGMSFQYLPLSRYLSRNTIAQSIFGAILLALWHEASEQEKINFALVFLPATTMLE